VDRVGYVEYEYDAAGHLEFVTNYDKKDVGTRTIIAQDEYDYDARGSLLNEWQSIGAVVGATTPRIAYQWDCEETDISTATGGSTPAQVGHLRLEWMTYPSVAGASTRRVTMGYGAGGGAGDVLSRLDAMTCNIGEPTIAAFGYVGASRRASVTLAASSSGGGVIQTLDTNPGSVGLEGLDGFGRIIDLHYENDATTPDTLFRAQYTYDILGNRVSAELTQADIPDGAGTATQDNEFSQLNSYDALNRLVKTEYGTLSSGVISPNVRTDEWSLDLLGNWVGDTSMDGRETTGDLDWYDLDPPRGVEFTPDSGDDTFKWLQAVNPRNEIEQLDLDEDGTTSSHGLIYDGAGNLEFDGTYFYQYDAWNRLQQINEASWNSGTSSVDIGDIVKHYTYDGHGRLIRIQSPYPDPWTAQTGDFRTERLYYDGIRRIQEVIVDPVTGESGGGEEAEGEDGQIGGGQAVEYLSREYVWGPGDQGFDELLVQYNGLGDEFWAIMDAGGDLVALCDLGGSGGAARVVGQWTYDAYGAVLSADHLHAMAHPHLGHKGLFVDRLDAGIVAASGGPESPRLVPFAESNYNDRNRNYRPRFGRFLQGDPNETAQILMSFASHGQAPAPGAVKLSLEDLYPDGANRYQYIRSNTWTSSDPLGLFGLPFSMPHDDPAYFDPESLAAGAIDASGTVISVLSSLVSEYADNLMYDVEWAMDWTADDEWHSRKDNSWIDLAMMKGLAAHFGVHGMDGLYVGPDGLEMAQSWRNPIRRQGMPGENMIGKMGYYRGNGNGIYAKIGGWRRGRFYDGITEIAGKLIANEVKTGAQRLSSRIDRQLRKDLDLVNQGGPIKKIVWTFHRAKPDDIDPRLLQRLAQYRKRSGGKITWEFVD